MTSTTSGMSELAGQVATQAVDMGEMAVQAAGQAGTAVSQTAREYPVTTALMIAGIAFTLGALWKSGTWRRRAGVYGYMDRVGETVSDLPRRLRSEWR